MPKQSAGILVYRRKNDVVEVLLTHPAGPFWAKKDTWSIPKGEINEGEDLFAAAKREFKEETGFDAPEGAYYNLGESKQGSIKINSIWAVEGDVDIRQFVCSSTFVIEWPPKSGQQQTFPENDRAKWLGLGDAKNKLFKAQVIFVDRLAAHLQVDISKEVPKTPQNSTPEQVPLF